MGVVNSMGFGLFVLDPGPAVIASALQKGFETVFRMGIVDGVVGPGRVATVSVLPREFGTVSQVGMAVVTWVGIVSARFGLLAWTCPVSLRRLGRVHSGLKPFPFACVEGFPFESRSVV